MASKIIPVRNLLDQSVPFTYLSTKGTAGGTTFPVRNIDGFKASWGIQVGKTNEETAEILILGTATPSGTALTTTGTARFDHPTDTPIYAIKYDKVIFKRSTTGTAGVATAMTGGTVTITPGNEFTSFDDTSSATGYAYRVSYYASVLDVETDDSDWQTLDGFSFYSLAKIRERAVRKLFSASYIKEDSIVDDWVNEWLDKMNNTAINVNQDYSLGTVDISHGTAGLGTVTATDFKEIRRVWYTTNGADYYNATKMSIINYEPNEEFSSTHPYFYYQGDNVIGKKPDGEVGTARIIYYKLPTRLSNDADELPVSMWGYTKSFVDYCLAQAYYLDEKVNLGDRFLASSENELGKFKNEITPRSKTGPQYVTLVDQIDGESTI